MTRSTDDELDFDLEAWEVPEPPADLADGVLARMGGTGVVAAVPVEPRQHRRRAVLVAGVAAACIAASAATYLLVRSARPAGSTTGDVIAHSARSLSLDGVTADLDPGAEVHWQRKGGTLDVEQDAGAAAWRVDGDTRLVIDAGATLASVEATGASLRVEVKMNATDARVIGASALTAAAVSMVTVTVYTGHVKVSGNGQTVVVQPGATHTVLPAEPRVTVEPPTVGAAPVDTALDFDFSGTPDAEVRIPALESATIHAALMPVRVEIDGGSDCSLEVEGATVSGTIATLDAGAWDYTLTCGSTRRSGRLTVVVDGARRAFAPTSPPVNTIAADGRVYRISYAAMPPAIAVTGGKGRTLTVADASTANAHVRTVLRARGGTIDSGALAPGSYTFWYSPDKVSTLVLEPDTTAPVAYFRQPGQHWSNPLSVEGSVIEGASIALGGMSVPAAADGRFSAQVSVPGDSLAVRVSHPHRGIHYFVLRPLQLRVKPQPQPPVVIASAGKSLDRAMISQAMASVKSQVSTCAARSSSKGKVKVRVNVKPDGTVSEATATEAYDAAVGQCIVDIMKALRFPVTDEGGSFSYPFVMGDGFTACNVETFKDKGMQMINMGQHAAALAQFELALQCKDDPYVRQLAFMSACSSKNAAKAALYYQRLTSAQQQKFNQICIRNGIDASTATPSCDAGAHKDKGFEAINAGLHVDAVVQFEAAYKCNRDPTVPQIIVAQACAASDASTARRYYVLLSGTQKAAVLDVCAKLGITLEVPPAAGAQQGFLEVRSMPAAKILVDGKSTGLTTPITGQQLKLAPGKHKITFVIGDDRFTYPIVITAGRTEVMSKDLRE